MSGKRFALRALMSAGLFAGAVLVVRGLGLRVNESPSLPVGIWKIARLERAPQAGDIVSLCPPDTQIFREARRRGYLGYGICPGGYQPLLKPIAAMEGDLVSTAADGIRVNGRRIVNSGAWAADRAGWPLTAVAAGSFLVAKGEAWVISSYNAASFDSRYFGAVPDENIQGIATPLLVFE